MKYIVFVLHVLSFIKWQELNRVEIIETENTSTDIGKDRLKIQDGFESECFELDLLYIYIYFNTFCCAITRVSACNANDEL